MKILHVARYGSVKGGTESYLAELCRAQREAGFDVALAYRFDPDESRAEVRRGAQLSAITSGSPSPADVEQAEVRRVVEAFAPDMIHVHNAEAAWLPGFLRSFAPVVHGVHDHRLDCPTGTRYWAAWNRACSVAPGGACLGYNVAGHCGSLRANATLEPYLRWKRLHRAAVAGPAIQVFSEHMASSLRRVGIAAPVTVTPYPCPSLPEPSPVPASSAPVVFASGRATKEKGFDLLIDALRFVRSPVRCVVAGDGHHLPALRRKAAGRVEFAGWTDRATLAGWLRVAAVVAVPSAWPEPFGIAGLEAMAAGKPVVATDIGGIREWLAHDETGLVVPPRDPAAFGRAIQSLLDDPAKRERFGDAGRRRIAESFTIDAHLSRVIDMYEQARRGWEAAA